MPIVLNAVTAWDNFPDVKFKLHSLVLELLRGKDSNTLEVVIACGGLKSLVSIMNGRYPFLESQWDHKYRQSIH